MMGDSGLVVANSIKVLTQNGECQIDLCLGDITKLKKKDKVDVICVSAFRGDYAPTPTSVIGALKRSLGILVYDLARDKQEDLRNLYSCWWSKPLPSHLPYKRLLCFETGRSSAGRPQELVANVFRCLVPILNNEDGTVITPLLNTGDQGYGEVSMLTGMVKGAVNWMKAGLPLRLLKLVLYARVVDGDLKSHTMRRFDEVLKKFAELKERYEMQLLLPKAVPLEFDVYLSFSDEDEAVAKVIREKLSGAKDGIRIYDSSQQVLNKEDVFQQDMYSVMMKSARVVTVLSPNYLKNKACIEQYNIALCCNRRALRDMLAPFYVDSVELMPTYMGLVQYVDCRPHDQSKIQDACSQLSVTLTVRLHTELRVAEFDPLHYDVFLSYSHRDTEKANLFVKTLQRLAPDLKLFFDVQELKTGKSWQRTLYHSIDGSRCMLALISAPYLKSAVCQEEFALAQAKHYAKGKQHLQLIPICLEDLESIPTEFSHIPMVKGTPDVLEETVQTVCPAVVQWLKGEKVDKSEQLTKIFDDVSISPISPDEEMETFRTACFQKEFGETNKVLSNKTKFPPSLTEVLSDSEESEPPPDERPTTAEDPNVVFSYHGDDEKYVDLLTKVLKFTVPKLRVETRASHDRGKLDSLERADCIIPILSPNFLESPECVEEFHIAIWRQRISNPDAPHMFPIQVHSLPQKPTYFHLVACPVSLTDGLWAKLTSHYNVGLLAGIQNQLGSSGSLQLSRTDALALVMAAYKVLEIFKIAKKSEAQNYPPKSALFNIMKLKERSKQITQPDFTEEVQKILLELHLDEIPSDWRQGNVLLHGKNEHGTQSQIVLSSRESHSKTNELASPVATQQANSNPNTSHHHVLHPVSPTPDNSHHQASQDRSPQSTSNLTEPDNLHQHASQQAKSPHGASALDESEAQAQVGQSSKQVASSSSLDAEQRAENTDKDGHGSSGEMRNGETNEASQGNNDEATSEQRAFKAAPSRLCVMI